MTAQIAAYYFPDYHVDPRNEAIHGAGWTEWELMKLARPRFPGHQQPKLPLWGFEDEADPRVMARKIDTAARHGLDAFVFDWYWYEGPYLERCLDEGFLKAPNASQFKFALMWANHDWKNFHPGNRQTSAYNVNFAWNTSPKDIDAVWDYIVGKYFVQPNYWRVGGLPYFSIYQVNRFIRQMGGLSATCEVLRLLRQKARAAGLPGVHLNGIWNDLLDPATAQAPCPQSDWALKLGFSSFTSYNEMNFAMRREELPLCLDYDQVSEGYLQMARKVMPPLPVPYFPVITCAWDSTPRCIQSEKWDTAPGYPYLPVMQSTPEQFGKIAVQTLALTREFPEQPPVVFINAWNEWTEGSYLEPDQLTKFQKLEALFNAKNAQA